MTATSFVRAEIESQPEVWALASETADVSMNLLPKRGERVAIVGCGTSWFIAQAYASLRETSGGGETDAFVGSEFPRGRAYDVIIAITRSGTTTEIVNLLRENHGAARTLVITGVADSPAAEVADAIIELAFADEQSVVQTRFATSALVLLRRSLGEDIAPLISDARRALTIPIENFVDVDQVTFLGTNWRIGLASEAALKSREAAQLWTEAYPAMDYRHGPISIAQPGRLVWSLGPAPEGLEDDILTTGAYFVNHDLDPLADLIVAQRFAVAVAESRGLNPDQPRALTRSVILD